LDLAEGEEVLFELDHVVLTNLRLMADWSNGRAKSIVAVKDIDGVRRLDGGQESRLGSGIKILGVGAVLMALQLLVERFVVTAIANSALNILNVIFFVIAAVGLGVGLHVIVTSLVRVKPHTSLLFVRFKNKDILVSFPGLQNEDAEKLRAAFNRQQRAIPF
jgi:hypothetical protein